MTSLSRRELLKATAAGLLVGGGIPLINPRRAEAAPSISGTSGTWTHGGNVTISGSGFGATGPVGGNLLLWDDFSDGVDGQVLNVSPQVGSWTLDNRPSPVYDNAQSHGPGGLSSLGINVAGNHWSNFYVTFAQQTKLYQAFWFRWNYDGTSGQMKLSQIHGNDGGDFAPGIMTGALDLTGHGTGSEWWASYRSTEGGICDIASRVSYIANPGKNTWYLFERILEQSTANADCAATGNGRLEHIMTDGVSYWSQYLKTNIVTRENSANGWIEASFSHGMTNIQNTLNNWVADAYLSATLARVLIGNNATLGSSTVHREIQRCTAWADGSITIVVNRGSFGANDAAYLFVVDESNVASSGFAITFGAGAAGGGSRPAVSDRPLVPDRPPASDRPSVPGRPTL